jgi:hypothetical protein
MELISVPILNLLSRHHRRPRIDRFYADLLCNLVASQDRDESVASDRSNLLLQLIARRMICLGIAAYWPETMGLRLSTFRSGHLPCRRIAFVASSLMSHVLTPDAHWGKINSYSETSFTASAGS